MFYFYSSKKTYFLNRVLVYIYLPKTSKYLYINLNISIFLPRASNSVYKCPYGSVITTYIAMSPTAVVNFNIKSYSPYFNIILAHTELLLIPHIKSYVPYNRVILSDTELFPLTVEHNVNLNKLHAVLFC